MKLKRVIAALSVLGLVGLAGVRKAWAINPDQLTISVTPTVAMNIAIATGTVQWNSGDTDLNLSLSLGTTDYLVKPATVTYTGTFSGAEIDLQGVDNMAAWAFDADDTAGTDQLQVYVLFSSNTVSAAPTPIADWTAGGDDRLGTTSARVGATGGDNNNGNFLNVTDFAGSPAENLIDSTQNQMHMWIRLDVPPDTSSTAQQDFSITVTATNTSL